MICLSPPPDFNPKFSVVSCLCDYKNKILLLQRQDGKPEANTWGLPAGKVSEHEDLHQAVARELAEETGLQAPPAHIQYLYKVYARYAEYDFIFHLFKYTLTNSWPIILNPQEHQAFTWVSQQKALTMPLIQDLAACLKLSTKTHLIFDFDNTLVKLQLPWEHCIDTIKPALIKLDQDLVDQFSAGTLMYEQLINQFLLKHGRQLKPDFVRNALAFEALLGGALPNQDLLDLIRNNSQYHVSIWSSNTRPTITSVLGKFKLTDSFEKIISLQDVMLLKPYPEGFTKIYDKAVAKEQYLMFGDIDSDQEAATNAGIDFYHINYFANQR